MLPVLLEKKDKGKNLYLSYIKMSVLQGKLPKLLIHASLCPSLILSAFL